MAGKGIWLHLIMQLKASTKACEASRGKRKKIEKNAIFIDILELCC